MIGRGAVRNPAIFREIKGGEPLKTEELIRFSKLLEERYFALLDSDRYTLHRLKEIWIYAMDNYKEEKKILKAVKKSSMLSELNSAIEALPLLK
jgi:tRNA-dihydrouridine synthase